RAKGTGGAPRRGPPGAVLKTRDLTTLIRDLPQSVVQAVPADLKPVPWDREKIHQLFDTLQFRVRRARLYQTFPNGLPGAEEGIQAAAQAGQDIGGFEVDATVVGPDEVASWLAEH